jgi:4-amino-4-deoxy-L-arabinose transferase-like glycosyltransferase
VIVGRRLRLAAFAALVAGLLLRTVPLLLDPTALRATCDGQAYHDLAVSFVRQGSFTIDDPGLVSVCYGLVDLGPSHHFAPGLPLIEAPFIALLGDTPLALVIPLLLLSWLAVVVAGLTTRDLYGNNAALLVSAAVSLDWTGVVYGTFLGYSENLVLIGLTLTLWAVLRGLRDERFITAAGLFAGIGYLAKASVGWFFLLAGLGGVLYRLIFRGWQVLKSRSYWAGVALFALPVALWSLRNIAVFWNGSLLGLADSWQTSKPTAMAVAAAVQRPDLWALAAAVKAPVLLVILGAAFVPLAGPLRAALRDWKREDVFGLWLTVGLIFILGWFFASAFWVVEQNNLFWGDHARYIMPAQIPLLWLVVRRREASAAGWSISFVVRLAMCLLMPLAELPGLPLAR